ncbi:30S ribosomal protein S13 [Candidatus Woesearchaeota archaeon]|nr:30S ribosomal protein S13 [Candidatus Woesearchaeota archaeon]
MAEPKPQNLGKQAEEIRHLVRIANTDLDGRKPVYYALTKIKGVNYMFSNFVATAAKVDKHKKTGLLSDGEVKRLEEAVKNPMIHNPPAWLLNRRKDAETGKDVHLTAADLDFAKDTDIKIMKKIKSYRGVRHILGLPVRGQRTKSNFRKNKGKVMGVKRKPGAKAGRT